MHDFSTRRRSTVAALVAAVLVAACAAPPVQTPAPEPAPRPTCQAPSAEEPLIGNWLSVRKQKGVAGELRTLFTLNADGTMAYTEQLKRGKHPSQGLAETGCWDRNGNTMTLRTLESNGATVSLDDPIYTNRYTVLSADDKSMTLRDAEGAQIKAKRMSPGYRLPF